jgi:hypothetical protein
MRLYVILYTVQYVHIRHAQALKSPKTLVYSMGKCPKTHVQVWVIRIYSILRYYDTII